MPFASPSLPEVRANTRSYWATCIPVLKRLAPFSTQSSPLRSARVSSHVASLPCPGSVRPNAHTTSWRSIGSISSRCSAEPSACRTSTIGKLPTHELSVCRSLCSPEWLVRQMLPDAAPSRSWSRRNHPARPAAHGDTARPRRRGASSRPAALPIPGPARRPLEVGASELAAIVEELRMLVLQRDELALDERVDLRQQRRRRLSVAPFARPYRGWSLNPPYFR